MKKSIIYLGIALVAFSNVINASKSFRNQESVEGITTEQNEVSLTGKDSFEKLKFNSVEDIIMDPEKVITLNLEKPIEEIIAENNQIIESNITNEISFLYIEKPIEEVIAENNQIIESTVSTEIRPLYLERTIEDIIAEDNKIIESSITNEMLPLSFKK